MKYKWVCMEQRRAQILLRQKESETQGDSRKIEFGLVQPTEVNMETQ